MDDTIALMSQGRFDEALAALRRATTSPADQLNLAIAEDRTGNHEEARRLLRAIAAAHPDWDEPWLRLAESHRAAHEREEAMDAYRETLRRNPHRPEALTALGGLLLLQQQPEAARDILLRGVEVAPARHEAWNALGLALQQTGAPALARQAFIAAQSLRIGHFPYILNGVDAAVAAEETEDELARLTALYRANRDTPILLAGQGALLARIGRIADAIDTIEIASVLLPQDMQVLRLLAGTLARSGRVRQAERTFRRLRNHCPDDPQVCNDHAAVLMRLHRHVEARATLREIIDRNGAHPSVLCNLANATTCVGLQDEAVALARQAIELAPNEVLPRRALCNTLPYRDGTTAGALLDAMRDCNAVLPRAAQPALANTPDPDRPLTIGLLSGTLRSHPVGWLTVAGFEALDRNAFALVALSQNTEAHDPITRRFRSIAREWIDVDTLTDQKLTERARDAGIDILIDLGGYGDAARMPACANRLAPVQMKWVGMQAHSSGLAEMDWFVTDRWETPDGFEQYYTEKLLRLRDGYVCYSPPAHAPDVAPLPALGNGHITFGCFNNIAKLSPRTIATWGEILRRVPDARMLLQTHILSDEATAERIRASFAGHGIDPARIQTQGSLGHRALLAEYARVDIVLDPLPYSGGLTTCEALWMGVPTLTVPGEIFASRHSASHMSNAGLSDWVKDSPRAYVAEAIARANDIAALAALRATLRDRVRQSPLCDAPRFGESLGMALRHAWRLWCAGFSR